MWRASARKRRSHFWLIARECRRAESMAQPRRGVSGYGSHMLRQAKTTAPSFAVAALLLGLAAPAFADVAPPRPPPVEATPPPEVEAPPPETEPQAPETAAQPTPEAAPPQAQPEAKGDAKAATDGKSGSCSIEADSEQTIAGFAALLMLIAGAALRGRPSRSPRP
jgi:hypothetical protein